MATKRENFNAILGLVKDNEELTNFIKNEISLLDKKASRSAEKRASKAQNNFPLYDAIKTVLGQGTPLTITQISKASPVFADVTVQKITYLMTALEKQGEVQRKVEKGKALYSIPTATVEA